MSLPPPTTAIALLKVVRTARIQAGLAPSQIVTACRALVRRWRATAAGAAAPDGRGTAKEATSRSALPGSGPRQAHSAESWRLVPGASPAGTVQCRTNRCAPGRSGTRVLAARTGSMLACPLSTPLVMPSHRAVIACGPGTVTWTVIVSLSPGVTANSCARPVAGTARVWPFTVTVYDSPGGGGGGWPVTGWLVPPSVSGITTADATAAAATA